ncbi:MAG: TerB family tellurite resistance protein [Planctomycetota bacterium]
MLEPTEAEAVVTIALMAALADGRTAAEEREQLKSLLESLAADHDLPSLGSIHQRVLLKKVGLADAAAKLRSKDARRTAFELAVIVADADGKTTENEQRFLDELERLTGTDHAEAVAFEKEAETIALAPLPSAEDRIDPSDLLGHAPAQAGLAATESSSSPSPPEPDPVSKEVDGIVIRYAVLNGALELLPQNLATMAILPLQTRMVYAIGKRYGYSLDAGHIKEFIATLGLGATSQMLENVARKFLGKLAKKTLGKTAGTITKAATGPMMTFAGTYAIGRVAKAYYAGGRTLSAVDLRSMFQRDLAQGKGLFDQHRGQIEASATTLSPTRVLDMVRGKAAV